MVRRDLAAEVERLRAAGVTFRNDIFTAPGGSQILVDTRRAIRLNYFSSEPT